MQVLIIDREYSSSLLPGFVMCRKELAQRLGFHFRIVKAENIETMAELARGSGPGTDAVIMTLERCDPVHQGVDVVADVREHRPDLALGVMDAHDHSFSNHFGVLPYVEAFLSPNPMRPRWTYLDEYEGGTPLTDLLADSWDLDLDDWWFGEEPEPTLAFYQILAMWSSGVNPRCRKLLRWGRKVGEPWDKRPQEIYRRLPPLPGDPRCHHVGVPDWQRFYRRMCARQLAKLSDSFQCGDLARAPHSQSIRELLKSRIAVSGFGCGEILPIDFYAICCGSLLIKPAVAHLETYPEIFVDHETYIPIRWDMADLKEVCAFYLARPEESQRIIANAQAALADFFESKGVVQRVESLVTLLTERGEAQLAHRNFGFPRSSSSGQSESGE